MKMDCPGLFSNRACQKQLERSEDLKKCMLQQPVCMKAKASIKLENQKTAKKESGVWTHHDYPMMKCISVMFQLAMTH